VQTCRGKYFYITIVRTWKNIQPDVFLVLAAFVMLGSEHLPL